VDASAGFDWDRCRQAGCRAARLPEGEHCWAHVEGEALAAALERIGADGRLDGRGVRFTAERLGLILDHARRTEGGDPPLR
jgi:hypothetical protein